MESIQNRESGEERQRRLQRERNERYRQKKKMENQPEKPKSSQVTSPLTITTPNLPSQEMETPRLSSQVSVETRLSMFVSVSLSVSITVLLCYFQADAYIKDKMVESLAYSISIICETVFLYVSASLRRSFIYPILFLAMFSYNLGIMSYPVYKNHSIQKNDTDLNETKLDVLGDVFEKAKTAFDLAAARGQIKNARSLITTLEKFGEKIAEPVLSENKEEKIFLDKEVLLFQAISLIALRAILMLFNAVLIHRILARD